MLRRLIRLSPDQFAGQAWGRQPLLSRRYELPRDFADLLTLANVDELLSRRGLRTPFLRIARDGKVIDPARWTRGGGAGAEIADQVADDRVLALFADGCTVVLQALHRIWPPVIELAAALTAELGHPVQVNAYVTPPSSRGFSAHYDVHDVFVLQAAGCKRWQIWSPVVDAPLRDQPWTSHTEKVRRRAEEEPLLDVELGPGDALYLPRGFLHAAEALGEVSAHLTVGVHPVTRWDIVHAVTAMLADDVALRTSLPLGLDVGEDDTLLAHIAATLELLAARLLDVDRTDVAARVAARVLPSTRPGPVLPLATAAALARLGADTAVRVRPGLAHRLARAGERVTVTLPDRALSLPVAAEAAVRQLLAGGEHRAGRLAELDEADAVVLTRRLVTEGVVVPTSATL